MPHYFFNMDNGIIVPDLTGVEFANQEAAKAHARLIAGGFRSVGPQRHIVVIDDKGKEIYRTAIVGYPPQLVASLHPEPHKRHAVECPDEPQEGTHRDRPK